MGDLKASSYRLAIVYSQSLIMAVTQSSGLCTTIIIGVVIMITVLTHVQTAILEGHLAHKTNQHASGQVSESRLMLTRITQEHTQCLLYREIEDIP